MRAPRCPLCGAEHWSTQTCAAKEKIYVRRAKDRENDKKRRTADQEREKKLKDLESRPLLPATRSTRRWQLRNQKKYNAYMKDYMRKMRARHKEQKSDE